MPEPRRLAAVPDTPPRAVLYLRQSVSREDSISLELQETAGREHCHRLGYKVVAVEADPGISGRTWDRPAVQRVMAMIEAGDADVVVVWKWSRLSRSRRDWAVAIDRIESFGGRMESATEPVDATTATGRFTRGMLAEMAAFESDRIGEVWREVHARRLGLGLPSRGGDRFGYLRQDDGTYLVDPVTGPLLAEAYRRVVDGHSLRAVTAWLNESGARTLAGNPFTRDRLVRVLDSGFGAGQIVRQPRKGRHPDRSLGGLSWTPGTHPAIISADDWRAYLATRALRAPQHGQTGAYLLTGLVSCGDCGAPMWADRGGIAPGHSLLCSRWKEHRDVRCVSIRRHRAEAMVLDWLRDHAAAIEAAAVEQLGTTTIPDSDEALGLSRELARVEAQQARLLQAWLDDRVPEDQFDAAQASLRARRDGLQARLDSLTLQRRQRASSRRRRLTPDLLRDWDLLPLAERQVILRAVLPTVRVMPPERRGGRAWLAFGDA